MTFDHRRAGQADDPEGGLSVDKQDSGWAVIGSTRGGVERRDRVAMRFVRVRSSLLISNGDGVADLEASNWTSSNVGILLGLGDGTFATAIAQDVVSEPGAATAGDFNGDGLADLAVSSTAQH